MTPTPALTKDFDEWFKRPSWTQGGIGRDDALFLLAMLQNLNPFTIAEIGTCSGVSTAVIAWWMKRAGETRTLNSYDIASHCYFDRSIPCGKALSEMLPNWSQIGLIELHECDFEEDPSNEPIDFAFVDGSHLHPATAYDILALSKRMGTRSWIVMHDIRLMKRWAHFTPLEDYGPQLVFDNWKGEKIDGGRNIGAIRLYDGCDRDIEEIIAIPSPTRSPAPQG